MNNKAWQRIISLILVFACASVPLSRAWAQKTETPAINDEASGTAVETPADKAAPLADEEKAVEQAPSEENEQSVQENDEADTVTTESESDSPIDPAPAPFNLEPAPPIKQGLPNVDIASGSLSYALPLRLPPGRGGIQPDLALVYNSQDSEEGSLFGFGWSLSLSSIERRNLKGLAAMYAAHDFSSSFDGDLKEVQTSGSDISFAPKIDNGSFSSYTFHNQGSASSWTVRTKGGITYTFGNSAPSRMDNPANSSQIFKWYLTEISDTRGNTANFSYAKIDGQVYPASISYTNFNQEQGIFRVDFILEDRQDKPLNAKPGFIIKTGKRLQRIDSYVSETLVGRYQLAYEYAPVNGRSRLIATNFTGYPVAGSETVEEPTAFEYDSVAATGLLTKITLPSGGITEITYKPSTQYHNASGAQLNPRLPFVINTVQKLSYDDGNGVTWDDNFEYAGGWYYYNGPMDRRFVGFERVAKTDQDGNKTISYYHQGNGNNAANNESGDEAAKMGKQYRQEIIAAGGAVQKRLLNTWETAGLGSGRSFVKLGKSLEQTFDSQNGHADRAVTYTYFENGNLKQQVQWGSVQGNANGTFTDIGGDKLTTDMTYANDPTHTVFATATEAMVDEKNNKVSEVRYYYDELPLGQLSLGNQTQQERWKSGPTYVSSQKSYNAQGLPISEVDPRGLTTFYEYDQPVLYPAIVTNELGQATQMTYEYAYGQAIETRDANRQTFTTVYDGLGRVLEEWQPDRDGGQPVLKKANEYTDTPNAVRVKQMAYVNDSDSIDTYTYLDGFGRVVQERSEGAKAGDFNVRDFKYGANGLVSKESLAYISSDSERTPATETTNLYTEYAYDALDRPLSAVNAVGTTATSYEGWKTTITDPAGKVKDLYRDAYGNLTQVKEHNNGTAYATTYQYNGLQKLTKLVDASGNLRNFSYDGLGAVTFAEDLHAKSDPTFGTWTYEYDAAGNLLQRTDPMGQTVEYAYDGLNRIISEDSSTETGVEVTYLYDACENGTGRLCSVSNSASSTAYAYDTLGTIKQESRVLGTTTYGTAYTADRQGNRLTLTNQDGSVVRYSYDFSGHVNLVERMEVSDAGFGPVVSITYNALGLPVLLDYANGAQTANTYDVDELYRLRQRVTIANKVRLQDLTYTYDPAGNITRIVDASDTRAARTTDFAYDDLYRLISATITNPADGGVDGSNLEQTFAYDPIGNITYRSDVGEYLYEGNLNDSYANPHAVTSINGQEYAYDMNGNMILTPDGTSYTWNYNNRLIEAGTRNGVIDYGYEPSGQRVSVTTPEGTTYYPSASYSTDGNNVDKHIFLNDIMVATVRGSEQNAVPHFLHTDHLTGSNIATDSGGGLEELTDYYAFGAIRLDDQSGDFKEKRKFTGHEYDVETDLTYANARYYDAKIGRWLSQDPLFVLAMNNQRIEQVTKHPYSSYLADPQGLNAYSYVKNNPLKYKDASGYYFETVIDIIFLGISVYDFYRNPSWGNGAFVGLDAIGVAFPIPAVAGYIKNGARVVKIANYFSKVARNADDVIHLSKLFTKNVGFSFTRRAWSIGEAENDVASLVGHFYKHGGEFNAKSVRDYYNKANDFIDSNQGVKLPTGGDRVEIWDTATNTLAVTTKDGAQLKTFHKVTDPSKINAYNKRLNALSW